MLQLYVNTFPVCLTEKRRPSLPKNLNTPSVHLLPLLCCCSNCHKKKKKSPRRSTLKTETSVNFPPRQHCSSTRVRESDRVLFTDGVYVIR